MLSSHPTLHTHAMSRSYDQLRQHNSSTHMYSPQIKRKKQTGKVQQGLTDGPSGKEPTCQCRRFQREMQFQSLGQENLLEKGMATCSSILAWRIQWTEEPGGLQFIRSQTVRDD